MKLSWLFVILLLIFVAVFSVQNAGVITVRFLTWEFQISAALVIQLGALLGGLVGLGFGAWSRRAPKPVDKPATASTPPAPQPIPARPALPAGSSSPAPARPLGSSAGASSSGSAMVIPPAVREEKKPTP
jgi:hypothetical protein